MVWYFCVLSSPIFHLKLSCNTTLPPPYYATHCNSSLTGLSSIIDSFHIKLLALSPGIWAFHWVVAPNCVSAYPRGNACDCIFTPRSCWGWCSLIMQTLTLLTQKRIILWSCSQEEFNFFRPIGWILVYGPYEFRIWVEMTARKLKGSLTVQAIWRSNVCFFVLLTPPLALPLCYLCFPFALSFFLVLNVFYLAFWFYQASANHLKSSLNQSGI